MNLEKICLIVGIIFVISVILDLSITYVNYHKDPDYFLSHESNEYLVWELKNKQPYLLTIPFVFLVFLTYIYLSTFVLITNLIKNKIIKHNLLLFLSLVYLFMAYQHFIGFLSWIS
jgi:uncharacterized membrane protein